MDLEMFAQIKFNSKGSHCLASKFKEIGDVDLTPPNIQ